MLLPETGRRPVQFADVFPHTTDRKVHLCPPSLDAESARGIYAFHSEPVGGRYPLALISPSVPQTVSSTFGQLRRGPVPLEMHPDDAAARGLNDDKPRVRVFNDYGELRCRVRLNPDLKRGVALFPKGVWARGAESGTNACALSPDTLTDIGAGACFNDARVEVEALRDAPSRRAAVGAPTDGRSDRLAGGGVNPRRPGTGGPRAAT